MKRKLIKQGLGGFTLYLPKHWIDERSLKAGDEIDLFESGSSLVLSSKSMVKKEVTVDIKSSSKRELYIKLTQAYRTGFDKIIIKFQESESIKSLQDVVSENLLGFEITNREKNKIILENITEPTDEKFGVILRRIFLQLIEVYNLVKNDFSNNSKDNFSDIESSRNSIDRYIFFCRRLISKKMNVEENSILHWELLTFLMHITHNLYYTHSYYYKSKDKISKETLGILSDIGLYLDNYYKSYFEKDESYLDSNEKKKVELENLIFVELESSKNKNKVILSFFRELVRFIQIGGSPIRSLLFDERKQPKS